MRRSERGRGGNERWTRFVPFAEGAAALLGGEFREERGGGHDQAHMPVPATPGTGLAVIQAEIVPGSGPGQALRAQEAFLDGPAQTASAGAFGQIGARAGIGDVIRQGLAVAAMAAQQQPAFKTLPGFPAKANPRPLPRVGPKVRPRAGSQPRSLGAFAKRSRDATYRRPSPQPASPDRSGSTASP